MASQGNLLINRFCKHINIVYKIKTSNNINLPNGTVQLKSVQFSLNFRVFNSHSPKCHVHNRQRSIENFPLIKSQIAYLYRVGIELRTWQKSFNVNTTIDTDSRVKNLFCKYKVIFVEIERLSFHGFKYVK